MESVLVDPPSVLAGVAVTAAVFLLLALAAVGGGLAGWHLAKRGRTTS